MTLAIIVTVSAVGCSGQKAPQASDAETTDAATPPPVGAPVTVKVSPDKPFSVTVPEVGQISGDPGAFIAPGTLTIQPRRMTFDIGTGLQAAGVGLDVDLNGLSLRKPLTLAFQVGPKPEPDALPGVAHQTDDGVWSFTPATVDTSGRFVVTGTEFSIRVPGWANPAAWWRALTETISSGIGGRTAPLACQDNAPKWFHLDTAHSDLVHTCATTNHTDDGTEVAEVQIKSNRGVSIEVTVPGEPAYVWVEDMPWPLRQATGQAQGYDPNRTVILPAGKTMTVGYPRGYASGPFLFFVTGTTPRAAWDTVVREVLEFSTGELATGKTFAVAAAYTEIRCISGLRVTPEGLHFEAAEMKDFLGCWTSTLVDELKDLDNAKNVVFRFGGGDAATLVKWTKAVSAVGWLVALWPLFQIGWGNVFDKLNELFSDGRSAQVTFRFDPLPVPGETSPDTTSPERPLVTAGQCADRQQVIAAAQSVYDGFDQDARVYCDGDWVAVRLSEARETAEGRVDLFLHREAGTWTDYAPGSPSTCEMPNAIPARVKSFVCGPSS